MAQRPVGIHGPFLSHAQLMGLWVHYGGYDKLANVMAAIALAESRGGQYSLNHNPATARTRQSWDHGYWQDNWATYNEALFEPGNNTRRAILLAQGTPSGLRNWVTFNTGAYAQYLNAADNPIFAAPKQVTVTDLPAETVDAHGPRDSHDYSPYIVQTDNRHRRSARYLQQAATAFAAIPSRHARKVTFTVTEHTHPAPAAQAVTHGKVEPYPGNGNFAAQTTRPDGRRVEPIAALTEFLRLIAGAMGETIYSNTYSRHNQFVAGRPGVQSWHWTGEACDVHVTHNWPDRYGDRIAFHAFRLCGLSIAQADAAAHDGGTYTIYHWTHGGHEYQVQVLWGSAVGHVDHVHVGVKA